jgi:NAD(P)-dependent dehydrogenase (short-subunit alcohol dehydrogenase family)
MTTAVAVVTGGNRGLGLEVCRQLAAHGLRVVLAARSLESAEQAAAPLRGGKLAVEAAALDVTSDADAAALAAKLARDHGRIDVLVNNAGVSLRGFDAEVVRGTMAVNLLGVARVTDALLPLMAGRGAIANVSSGMGELSVLAPPLRKRFLAPDLDRAGLLALVGDFERAVAAGTHRRDGWPTNAYSVSKAALNALTRILARELAGTAVRVNSVCPGWVRTDMGGRSAPRGVREGAESIVWGALLPEGGATGGFFRDGEPIDW